MSLATGTSTRSTPHLPGLSPLGVHFQKFAHANSRRYLLWRPETMAMMLDVGLPVGRVRAQVVSAIDVIAHMA